MFHFSRFYFLLSNNAIIAIPTIAIAAIMPIDMGRKYCSASVAGGCVGSGVASGASSTPKAASAYEP